MLLGGTKRGFWLQIEDFGLKMKMPANRLG